MNFKGLRWLFLIMILVIVVRVVFFSFVPYNPTATSRDLYLDIARNVVAQKGFATGTAINPTAMRGPVPVYFFATILWAFGDHTLSIAIANWIVEVITCILLYLIALRLFNDIRIAFVTGLLFAIYGPGVFYSWQALSEPLFSMLLAAFVLGFLLAINSPSVKSFVIAGVLLGLAVHGRPIMQYFLPTAIIFLIWIFHSYGKSTLKWIIALTIPFVVIMTPWTVRNYLLFDKFIPVSSVVGVPLVISNFTLGEPDFLRPRSMDEAEAYLDYHLRMRLGSAFEDLTQPQYDQAAKELTVEIIKQYPGRYLLLTVVRFFRLWYFIYGAAVHNTSPPVMMYVVLVYHVILFVLAAFAFIFYRGDWWKQSIFIILLLLYYTAGYSVAHVQVRYIVPLAPYVMLFASVSLVNLWIGIRERIRPNKIAIT